MEYSRLLCVVVLWIPLVSLCACSREEKAPVVAQPQPVERIEPAELGDPIRPLDRGRIQISPPAGWCVPLRDRQWIIRFQRNRRLKYPNIRVTAEDYPNVADLSGSNVAEFAEQIAAAIEADPNTTKLSEAIEPIEFGDLVGITYASRGKVTRGNVTTIVDRLFIDTVVAGRKYHFELRAQKGTLDEYRPHLLGVACGMKLLTTGSEERSQEQPDEVEPDIEYRTRNVE